MYLSSFFVTLKLLQVNATMTCELREKKQLPTTMLQSSRKMRKWWRVELVTRTSAFIHYVILLHKYIELPILYKYFGIFYCESEIKYSENVYSKIMSQGQKRPQNSSDCSICNLDFKNFWGRAPGPPFRSRLASLGGRYHPATSTSFLIFREVGLPLYAFSYLAPLVKYIKQCRANNYPLAHTTNISTWRCYQPSTYRRKSPIDRAMDEQNLCLLRHPTWPLNERKITPNQCLDHRFDAARLEYFFRPGNFT